MRIESFGLESSILLEHADVLAESPGVTDIDILRAWKGISRYPLNNTQKEYLRHRLISSRNHQCLLMQLVNPYVIYYRFPRPNAEYRCFLLSRSGHLFESLWSKRFFPSFGFLQLTSNGFEFLFEEKNVLPINYDLAWFPQSLNYTHFLCDFFAPWIPFNYLLNDYLKHLKYLHCHDWSDWQKQVFSHFYLPQGIPITIKPGQLLTLQPNSVTIPVLSSEIQSTLCLRDYFTSNIARRSYNLNSRPVFMIRNSDGDIKNIRVTNQSSIMKLVSKYNGINIDPSTLSIDQKHALFSNSSVVIGEGSATLNFSLFANQSSLLVGLTDQASIQNNQFLDGGWPYLHTVANQSVFIPGEEPKYHSSNHQPTEYSLTSIEKILLKYS